MNFAKVNWRRGGKRVAALYGVVSIVVLAVAICWDATSMNCPTSYLVRGIDVQNQATIDARFKNRESLRGKCNIVPSRDLPRVLAGEQAAERLGLPKAPGVLPTCLPSQLQIPPQPRPADAIVEVSSQERRECIAAPWHWQTTIKAALWIAGIPILIALGALMSLLLARLALWIRQGFTHN